MPLATVNSVQPPDLREPSDLSGSSLKAPLELAEFRVPLAASHEVKPPCLNVLRTI